LSPATQIDEVLSAVRVKTTVFWSVTPCGLVDLFHILHHGTSQKKANCLLTCV